MKILKRLFIIFIIYIHNSCCSLEAVCDTGKEIWKLYSIIDNMPSTTSYSAFQQYKYQVIEVHKQLQKLEHSIDSIVIRDVVKSWSSSIVLYKSLDSLEIYILEIDKYYDNFYQEISNMTYDGDDLRYFMRSLIPDIEEKIVTIRKKVLESDKLLKQNLIVAIANYVTLDQPRICNGHRIVSEILFQLFKIIVIAEVKAHVMSATVNRYQYLSHDNSNSLAQLNRETLEVLISNYVNLFTRNVIITDEVYLRACEPDNNRWNRDKSFYELEGAFQTAIFRYNWGKCHSNTCHNMWFEESDKCEAQFYDSRSGCSGDMTECINLRNIEACVLKSGPYKFHHVNSTAKGLLGIPSNCSSPNSYMIEDSAPRNLSHSACACNCIENDNKISLSIMESNIKSNMVITGLRFIRHNGILYIQPREGKIYAGGRIRHYSERWIPLPENISTSQIQPISGNNRIFFFDTLRLPSNYVLTGVKFNHVHKRIGSGFVVEIFGVPFNFKNGKLDVNPNSSVSKQSLDNDLRKLLSFEPINPANSNVPLQLSPEIKNCVLLERSSLRHDFGQSTLPLFDAVPVTTYPTLPLGGIGIFHKGTNVNAGFISLKVYGIKYSQYFLDLQTTWIKNNRLSFHETQ